ncbi:MAG TPA: ABC transporter permease [Thermaerobacter sp.]
MRAILSIAANQILRLAADRGALVMLVLFPITLNLILGISLQKAFSPDFRLDRPLRVALAVEEGPLATPLGRILAEEVPGDLWAVENAASADAARALVRQRQAEAAVIVPAGVPAEAIIVVSEPGTVAAGLTKEVVRETLAALVDPLAAQIPVDTEYIPAQPAGATTPVASRAMDYYAVAMSALMIFFAAARGTESLLQDRQTGVYFRVRAGGTGRATYLLGKLVGTVLTSILFMVVMAVATRLLFGVRWGDLAAWAVLTVAASLAAAGVNVVLMALIRRPDVLDGVSAAVFQVMGFFGGSMMPIYIFPDVMARISRFLPNRWMLDGYLAVAGGSGVAAILDEAAALALTALVLFVLGWSLDGAAARAAQEV